MDGRRMTAAEPWMAEQPSRAQRAAARGAPDSAGHGSGAERMKVECRRMNVEAHELEWPEAERWPERQGRTTRSRVARLRQLKEKATG